MTQKPQDQDPAVAPRTDEIQQGRLAALVDSSHDGIVGLTLEGVVTDWNLGAERLFGRSAGEMVGESIFSTVMPEDRRQETLDNLQRISRGERVEPFDTWRLRRDGSLVPVSVSMSPIRDREGRVIGASAIDRDITAQRAAACLRNAQLTVTEILAHERSADDAVSKILAAVGEQLGWDVGCFWRLDPAETVLRCRHYWQRPADSLSDFRAATLGAAFPLGETLPGRVWGSLQPAWIVDLDRDGHFVRLPEAEKAGLRSGFACPVALGEEFLGITEWYSRDVREPDDDLLEMSSGIGSQIGQFIERREAEQKLRRSEQELSDFFENAVVGLHWVGPDGIILRANQAELDLLGYSREEYVGRHISEFHADQPVIDDILNCLAAGKKLHDYPARLRCKDGSVRHVLIDSNVLWEDGQFIHTRCFTRDVSAQRHHELVLSAQKRGLELLVEGAPLPQVLDALCEVIEGRSEGKVIATVLLMDEDGERLRSVAGGRAPPSYSEAVDGVRIGPSVGSCGTAAWRKERVIVSDIASDPLWDGFRDLALAHELRACWSTPILSSEGDVLGTFAVYYADPRTPTDDEVKLVEILVHTAEIAVERRRDEQALREAGRRKDEFLAMLAHELRNPLAPIRSGLDLLAVDGGENQETLAVMQKQVEHLVRLVDDLLDVSRIMRGRVELRKETVDLNDLLRQSVNAVRPLIEAHQQKLLVRESGQPLWLHVDPVRLVQVLENLLNNASKYMDAGGSIYLEADRDGDQAVVSVRDEGIGIEPDLLPHVFDLFRQSSRSLDRAQGGLGIGLTLARTLVEMHGGVVTAKSPGPGQGSTFTVRLPLAQQAGEPKVDRLRRRCGRSHRILVVDDNEGAAHLLSKLLLKLGEHEIETAHDGHTALGKIRSTRPDMVLLDIGLPGLTGYQVASQIREDRDFDHMLLVAVTGYGQEEDRRQSREAGFDVHVVKPTSIEQLAELFAHEKLK